MGSELNAHDATAESKVVLPAAILQPLLFQKESVHLRLALYLDMNRHMVVDSFGHKYDGDGNEYFWWSWMSSNELI